MDRQTDGHMDRWRDEQTNGQPNIQTNSQFLAGTMAELRNISDM